jgi:hypothetical protein
LASGDNDAALRSSGRPGLIPPYCLIHRLNFKVPGARAREHRRAEKRSRGANKSRSRARDRATAWLPYSRGRLSSRATAEAAVFFPISFAAARFPLLFYPTKKAAACANCSAGLRSLKLLLSAVASCPFPLAPVDLAAHSDPGARDSAALNHYRGLALTVTSPWSHVGLKLASSWPRDVIAPKAQSARSRRRLIPVSEAPAVLHSEGPPSAHCLSGINKLVPSRMLDPWGRLVLAGAYRPAEDASSVGYRLSAIVACRGNLNGRAVALMLEHRNRHDVRIDGRGPVIVRTLDNRAGNGQSPVGAVTRGSAWRGAKG